MKVKYEFDTDNEDQRSDLGIYRQAINIYLALCSIMEYLRSTRKYCNIDGRELTDEEYAIVERMEEDIINIIIDRHNVNLEV